VSGFTNLGPGDLPYVTREPKPVTRKRAEEIARDMKDGETAEYINQYRAQDGRFCEAYTEFEEWRIKQIMKEYEE
jgi:hypothetical protein